MGAVESVTCEVCGNPASVHVTERGGATDRTRSFCIMHSPTNAPRGLAPFGPHRTAAEEATWIRSKIAELDQKSIDPVERGKFKEELELLVADIEAGRRRVGDGE